MTFRSALLLVIAGIGLMSSYFVFQTRFIEFDLFNLLFQLIFPGAPFLILAYYFTIVNEKASLLCITITFMTMALSVASPYAIPFFVHSAVISMPLIYILMPVYTALLTVLALGLCQYLEHPESN